MSSFSAFRIHRDGDEHRAGIELLRRDDLSDGEVLIRAAWSSVNYKDALAGTGRAPILRRSPLVGGIDVAGVVIESAVSEFKEGDEVLATGCGLSEIIDGGYSELVRLKANAVIPVPTELGLRDAMVIGTAGFTAALSLYRMISVGQTPEMGPIVVTGASGGVGMLAIDILASAGFEVHAISGKIDAFSQLQKLGARQCISRHKLYWGQRPLESASWAGAIDAVGGEMLEGLTRVVKPWGSIASCGMAGGDELHTTVMPFIIRGVSLLGINSAGCPRTIREELWQRLSSEWKPRHLDSICSGVVGLNGLEAVFEAMLAGQTQGRTLVQIDSDAP